MLIYFVYPLANIPKVSEKLKTGYFLGLRTLKNFLYQLIVIVSLSLPFQLTKVFTGTPAFREQEKPYCVCFMDFCVLLKSMKMKDLTVSFKQKLSLMFQNHSILLVRKKSYSKTARRA